MALLEQGDCIRYQGLGAGHVLRHVSRPFQGKDCTFAVISFPHRGMTVQLPVGDPLVMGKVTRVISKTACRKLLRSLREPGGILARTWDQREELGTEILRTGGPCDWVNLLRAYVKTRNDGSVLAASDMDIVRTCIELLAAELSAAEGSPYEGALKEVERAYRSSLNSPWQQSTVEVLVEA